jgi:hypothetical protein
LTEPAKDAPTYMNLMDRYMPEDVQENDIDK